MSEKNKNNKKNISKLFAKGEVKAIIDLLNNEYDLDIAYGPLNKSAFAYDFEKIIKHVLSGKKISYDKGQTHCHIILYEDNGSSKRYNLNNFIKDPKTLSSIVFEQDDFDNYLKYLKEKSRYKPAIYVVVEEEDRLGKKSKIVRDKWPTENDFKKNDKEGNLKDLEGLTYAEKLALNIYTGEQGFYTDANDLLRGIKNYKDMEDQKITDLLVSIAMIKSAINNAPKQNIEHAIRREQIQENSPFFIERHEAALNLKDSKSVSPKSITKQKGFISTSASGSFGDLSGSGYRYNMAFYDFKGVNIKGVSKFPNQNEILLDSENLVTIPLIKQKSPEEDDRNIYYSAARPISSPDLLSDEEKYETMQYREDLNGILKKFSNIEKNYKSHNKHQQKKLLRLLERHNPNKLIVDKINEKANELINDTSKSVYDKVLELKDYILSIKTKNSVIARELYEVVKGISEHFPELLKTKADKNQEVQPLKSRAENIMSKLDELYKSKNPPPIPPRANRPKINQHKKEPPILPSKSEKPDISHLLKQKTSPPPLPGNKPKLKDLVKSSPPPLPGNKPKLRDLIDKKNFPGPLNKN